MSSHSARVFETTSIGEAWIAVLRHVMRFGVASTYDGLAIRESLMVTMIVDAPSRTDDIIERFASPERLAWMHSNFADLAPVPELGDAASYATRLRDYAGAGLDQLRWVGERLRSDPLCRSATITTLQPLSDTSYVPCVSLLDFYLHDEALHLVVYAHSVDFGAKGYANLLELAAIQRQVAIELDRDVGTLTMIVKSAHVYDSDAPYVTSVLDQVSGGPD